MCRGPSRAVDVELAQLVRRVVGEDRDPDAGCGHRLGDLGNPDLPDHAVGAVDAAYLVVEDPACPVGEVEDDERAAQERGERDALVTRQLVRGGHLRPDRKTGDQQRGDVCRRRPRRDGEVDLRASERLVRRIGGGDNERRRATDVPRAATNGCDHVRDRRVMDRCGDLNLDALRDRGHRRAGAVGPGDQVADGRQESSPRPAEPEAAPVTDEQLDADLRLERLHLA